MEEIDQHVRVRSLPEKNWIFEMWTDSDRVIHTVALRDPKVAVDQELLFRIARASRKQANNAIEEILDHSDQLWAELKQKPRLETVEAQFVNQALPPEVFLRLPGNAEVRELGGLVIESSKSLDPRWQTDALSAARHLLSMRPRERRRLA